MSAVTFSDHIPDIDIITTYAERQTSIFSRISPWTKLIFLILIILMITISQNIIILTVLYITIISVFWLADLPVQKLVQWSVIPFIFVISLIGIMAWSEPGTVMITLPLGITQLNLTDNGIILVVTLLIKALISFSFSIFFLMTTRYEHFSGMIYQIFPSPLDQIFLMAYRFLFLTLAMTGALLKAVRSRGGGLIHSFRIQGRLFAEVAGLVFIRSFEQAERVNKAMISRGYNSGSYGARSKIPLPSGTEYSILTVAAIVVIITGWVLPHTGGV